MAEFCVECFLKLHPELKKSDLIIIRETDLCEGCGKIVRKTVLDVRESSLYKLNRK